MQRRYDDYWHKEAIEFAHGQAHCSISSSRMAVKSGQSGLLKCRRADPDLVRSHRSASMEELHHA